MRSIFWALAFCSTVSFAATNPSRTNEVRTLNTLREFPAHLSKNQWTERAREIREHVLVSCGLWPLPEKTPLNAKVFGRVEKEGYSIEKVYFESFPGFYVAGNLYRPLGKKGPFPAILNPHGHWANGRMADAPDGSIAARCISFARQGMIAFTYDMVGYNDTIQVNHKFASAPANHLWNISLMGVQTWNSVRALDFLESLDDVDKKRLACTGESGGGTQTFMLGAIEDRLAVQAPIVMVSHSMQGGCLCENARGLRVDYSNMEIAAVPAPRPQLLVAATGDWTKATKTVEGPAIEGVYRLFNAEDRFNYELFNFGHNYNQTSREAVYAFFGEHLLKHANPGSLKEQPYKKEPDKDLRVWPDDKLPQNAKDEGQTIAYLQGRTKSQLAALKPGSKKDLKRFQDTLRTAWKHSLNLELPDRNLSAQVISNAQAKSFSRTELQISRRDRNDQIPVVVFHPSRGDQRTVVVVAHPGGKSFLVDAEGNPKGIAAELLQQNVSVIGFDAFLTGTSANPEVSKARKPFANYFDTYNRTDLQERVQDAITVTAFAKGAGKGPRVVLCGFDEAGVWALLAAPAADSIVADLDAFKNSEDEWLTPALFTPGLYTFGGLDGAVALAAPAMVQIKSQAPGNYALAKAAFQANGVPKSLKVGEGKFTAAEILAGLK